MASPAKFRIDVAIHDLLMNSAPTRPQPVAVMGEALPTPVFPQCPEKLKDPGPETPPEKRSWGLKKIHRTARGWLFPYIRSRVLAGDFRTTRG